MPELIKVSAPGKILWIGSYSVVFGGLSHVIAVDKRVKCEVAESNEWVIETTYGTFRGYGNELTSSVIELMIKLFGNIGPYKIKLINDPEFQIDNKKTGLGSSAAATVALTAGLYFAINGRLDLMEIHRIAQIANYKRQGGIGSGFDIAAAVFGSIVYRKFSDIEKMDFYYKRLEIPSNVSMILGFTGRSSITVNLVKKFIESSSQDRFLYYLNLINRENEIAISLLERNRIVDSCEHVRLARKYLERLAQNVVGVKLVSEEEKELIRLAERNGAFIALSPGAGGGDSLFAMGENLDRVIEEWGKKSLKIIRVRQDSGVRVDEG